MHKPGVTDGLLIVIILFFIGSYEKSLEYEFGELCTPAYAGKDAADTNYAAFSLGEVSLMRRNRYSMIHDQSRRIRDYQDFQ